MYIKTAPSAPIEFLQNYTPYSPPQNTVVVDEIKNMITYDLQPSAQPTNIEYYIGTDKLYTETLTVKNITNTTKLKVTITFNSNVFIVDRVNFTKDNTNIIVVELQPDQTEQFTIAIKNDTLNQRKSYTSELHNIKMTVESYITNEPILKNSTASNFATKNFNNTIELN